MKASLCLLVGTSRRTFLKVPLFHSLLLVCLSFCVWGHILCMVGKRQEPCTSWGRLLLPPLETLVGAYEEYREDVAMDVGLRGQAGYSDAHAAACFTLQPTWSGHSCPPWFTSLPAHTKIFYLSNVDLNQCPLDSVT